MRTFIVVVFSILSISLLSQNTKGVEPMLSGKSGAYAEGNGGQTYAVIVGISDYQDPKIPDLHFAHRDAEAFAHFLRSPAGGSLDGDHLKLLANEGATGAQIFTALDYRWIIRNG